MELLNNYFVKGGNKNISFKPEDYDETQDAPEPYIEFDGGHIGFVQMMENKFRIGQVPIMVSNNKQKQIDDIDECRGCKFLLSITEKRRIQCNAWMNLSPPTAPQDGRFTFRHSPNRAYLTW